MHAAPDLIFSEGPFVIIFSRLLIYLFMGEAFFQRRPLWVASASDKWTFRARQLRPLGDHLEEVYLISQRAELQTPTGC